MTIKSLLRRHGVHKLTSLLLDMSSFAIGIFLTFKFISVTDTFIDSVYKSSIFLISSIISILMFRYNNLYKQRVLYSNLQQLISLLRCTMYTFLSILVMFFMFEPRGLQSSHRSITLFFVFTSYSLVIFNRFFIFRLFLKEFRSKKLIRKNIIVIGAGKLGRTTAQKFKLVHGIDFNVIGFVDDNIKLLNKRIDDIEVLGSTEDLDKIVNTKDVEKIFIAINKINHEDLFKIIQKCKIVGCPINVVSNLFNIVGIKINQFEYEALNFIKVWPGRKNVYQTTIKRILDVFLASIILILVSPLIIIIFISIKLSSRGPFLYVPISIGKDGLPFHFYKIRSMKHNVSDGLHRNLIKEFITGVKSDGMKLQNDSRITFIGKFIRKHSIDELAQLINVIKGEMSLVGPRPSTQYEYDMMNDWHKQRFSVLPGMTGLWQVSGRSEVGFNDMIMMDIYYVENCSFWFDFIILLKTFKVVIFGKGGY